jgi:PEGA domain
MKFILITLLILSSMGAMAQADIPELQMNQGIEYISGGIGSEESEAILALGPKWPLTLEFSQAHAERPLWVADVSVKIINLKTQKVIFTGLSDGPIMLINLPSGQYQLNLEFEGRPLNKQIQLDANKPQKLSIAWPAR